MPRTFALGGLVTRAKQRADMEAQGLISDAEWKSILHTVYGEFYSLVVETGMRHFEATQTITTDGSAGYDIPSDHLSTIGVDREEAAGARQWPLEQLMVQQRNRYSGASSGRAQAFALVGSQVLLFPTPPSGQTYHHLYVPQPADLTAAGDSEVVDVITADGENFIVWSAAVIALGKEESDVSLALAERERMRVRVTEWAVNRMLTQPRTRVVAGAEGRLFDDYFEGEY